VPMMGQPVANPPAAVSRDANRCGVPELLSM
jgi:hypothetical protein